MKTYLEKADAELTYESERAGYRGFYNRVVKRAIDLVLALILSVVVTPVILIAGIMIVIDDGFPVFYTPLRGGYRGKPFHIIKLRTMRRDADKYGGTTALNELGQIYNVLAGRMSFVGPRPELLRYTDRYEGDEKLILEVRPGITDFSSIEFINLDEIVGSGNADEVYETKVLARKNLLRIKYAREVSFATDVYLFFKTVGCVVKKATRVIFGKGK